MLLQRLSAAEKRRERQRLADQKKGILTLGRLRFKVNQDGSWSKIKRTRSLVAKGADS